MEVETMETYVILNNGVVVFFLSVLVFFLSVHLFVKWLKNKRQDKFEGYE